MNKNFCKIFVANSGSTFTNTGFEKAPDTASFVRNLANWFTDGRPGKFYFCPPPSIDEASFSLLAETVTKAGHTWTVSGSGKPENVDVHFIGESYDYDENVITGLMKNGGKICIFPDLEGAEGEEDGGGMNWNWSMWPFGFQYKNCFNKISGNQEINSDHPIFAGVKYLYQINGTSVINFLPDEQANQILVSKNGQGLYGICDLAKASKRVRISQILSDGTVKATEADEYIAITNDGLVDVDISGWRIHAFEHNKDFTFPAGTVLGKRGSLRVYTNEVHPESGGFSFGSKRSVWNNKADEGQLYDAQGNLVSSYAYTEHSQKLYNLMRYLDPTNHNLFLEADPAAIKAQKALGGKFSFEEAVAAACDCFEFYEEDETSAANVIANNAAALGVPYDYFDGDSVSSRYLYMRKPGVKITLCTPETPTLPTRGESIEANWIFMLKMPKINTVHWAIIDRAGEKEPYGYGTNSETLREI
jgi:hypothetical protein